MHSHKGKNIVHLDWLKKSVCVAVHFHNYQENTKEKLNWSKNVSLVPHCTRKIFKYLLVPFVSVENTEKH